MLLLGPHLPYLGEVELGAEKQCDTATLTTEAENIAAQALLLENRLRLVRAQRRTDTSHKGDASWFAFGLWTLGACMGVVTGLSAHEGISTTLLTSVLGLLGGGTLTIGAVRSEGSEVDVRQVGIGLFALGFGVLVAILPAAWVREHGLPIGTGTQSVSLRSTGGQELVRLRQQLDAAEEIQDVDAMSLACQRTLRPWSDTLDRCSLARKEVGDVAGAQHLERLAETLRSWR